MPCVGDGSTGLELAATVVLASARVYWAASQLDEQLTEATRSQAVFEQAKGMLTARSHELSVDAPLAADGRRGWRRA